MGILRIACFLGWCCTSFQSNLHAHERMSEDSIFVNGKLIRVQASVEIDTVSKTRRWQFGWNLPGPVDRRPIKQRPPTWDAIELYGRIPAANSGELGRSLDAFAHRTAAGGGGISWTRVMPRPGGRAWGFGYNGRLQCARTWGFDSALPDSLIGFLPAEERRSIQVVTRQEYELGVETDTLVVPLIPSAAWSLGLSALLRAEYIRNTPMTVAFGLERWSSERQSIWVREPSLDQNPIVVVKEEGLVWQPVISMGLERSW